MERGEVTDTMVMGGPRLHLKKAVSWKEEALGENVAKVWWSCVRGRVTIPLR